MTEAAASVPPDESVERVSTLELFFDLVFVFTITQLSTLLARESSATGVLQAVLMLAVIWWMYDGYAWLTNAVPPNRASRRALLLGAMAAFLVLALAIPGAFRGSGLTFGLAYLVVVLVHTALFSRSSSATVTQAVFGIARFNLLAALLVLAGGIAGGSAKYVLWAVAVVFEWITPRLIDDEGFEVGAAHFVERHGLVVIIALGESVVAVGIGATGLPIDLELVAVAVLGLLLSACLWWTYFGSGDAERAERALVAAPARRRPRLAVDGFGFWHVPILFGVIAVAATLRETIGHASVELSSARALFLGGGAALFMLGDVLFRRTLGIGRGAWRGAAAGLALATVPLGTEVSAWTQLAALVLLLGGALVAEAAVERPYLSGRSG